MKHVDWLPFAPVVHVWRKIIPRSGQIFPLTLVLFSPRVRIRKGCLISARRTTVVVVEEISLYTRCYNINYRAFVCSLYFLCVHRRGRAWWLFLQTHDENQQVSTIPARIRRWSCCRVNVILQSAFPADDRFYGSPEANAYFIQT